MASQVKQHLNTKAERIMDFCDMIKGSTSSAVEYFRHSQKFKKRHCQKPIIKKRITLSRELNGVEYINPNIESMIERIKKVNLSGAKKIERFINSFTM